MTFQRVGSVVCFCFAMATGACGYDCQDFCEDSADCPGSKTDPKSCDGDCQRIEDLNDASGCDDEWDKLMDCAGDLDNVCDDTESKKCNDEANSYLTCALGWCSRHQSASECK